MHKITTVYLLFLLSHKIQVHLQYYYLKRKQKKKKKLYRKRNNRFSHIVSIDKIQHIAKPIAHTTMYNIEDEKRKINSRQRKK